MNITGMEVIRPGVPTIGVLPGEKIELTYGDTLKVNVSFDYRGLARETILEGAIGKLHHFPTEWLEVLLKSGTTIDIPESLEFTTYERSVEIPITSDIDPGTDYDLSVSLLDYREAGHPTEVDVIDIVGIPPEYELIQETIYPYAYIYDGDAELVTATFKTDPFTPADWIADKVASKLEEEAKKEGGRVLEVRAWVDKTPLFWTDFRIEVISTPLRETAGGAPRQTGIPLWATVIIFALAIIAIIMVTYHFIIKPLTYKHKPISEKLKKTLPKPTLISMITAFEIELGLTPRPVAELEGMSDQELRDYCDMLAEEIVPPGIDWLPWVIGAGVGVLGLGTVAILAKKKK